MPEASSFCPAAQILGSNIVNRNRITARYVKTIVLYLDDALEKYFHRPKVATLSRRAKYLLHSFQRDRLSGAELPALSELQLRAKKYGGLAATALPSQRSVFTLYLREALHFVSASLVCLEISLPLENFPDLLAPPLHLPRLETLHVHIFISYLTTPHEAILQNDLTPFVARHALTIASLSISFDKYLATKTEPYCYDFPCVFRTLPHIPNLASLTVSSYLPGPNETDLSTVSAFISRHSDTLTALDLHLTPYREMSKQHEAYSFFSSTELHDRFDPATFLQDPLFTSAIPICKQLQHFTFSCLSGSTGPFPTLDVAWLPLKPGMAAHLQTLSLPDNELREEEVVDLFNTVDFPVLKVLELRMFDTSATFLDLLEHKLPLLRNLKLYLYDIDWRFERVSPAHQTPLLIFPDCACISSGTEQTSIHKLAYPQRDYTPSSQGRIDDWSHRHNNPGCVSTCLFVQWVCQARNFWGFRGYESGGACPQAVGGGLGEAPSAENQRNAGLLVVPVVGSYS